MSAPLQRLPATLAGLVTRYSPSGQEHEATAWLSEEMLRLGYEKSWRDEVGNAIGQRGSGSKKIVLLGHIDTVVGEIPTRQAGDLYYGRGTVDAKGPLACFVDAVARVSPGPDWQIIVIGAVGEESDSIGAWHAADQWTPDALIVGEPSKWDHLTLGYKGSISFRLTRTKDEAHSAGPDGTPADDLFAVWQRLQRQFAALNYFGERAFEQISPTVRSMISDSDGYQAWARLDVQLRLPISDSPAKLEALLRAECDPANVEVEVLGKPIPAYRAPKNTALVRAFLRSIRGQGGNPGFRVKTGTADLNIVGPTWNCPAVVYGPGDAALDHTPNEHISIQEYRRSVDVLKTVLAEMTAGDVIPAPVQDSH